MNTKIMTCKGRKPYVVATEKSSQNWSRKFKLLLQGQLNCPSKLDRTESRRQAEVIQGTIRENSPFYFILHMSFINAFVHLLVCLFSYLHIYLIHPSIYLCALIFHSPLYDVCDNRCHLFE